MADAGNRKALKARPVDVSLRLQIIRTPGDVGDDEPGSRVVPSHGHQLLDRENEEARPGWGGAARFKPPPHPLCLGGRANGSPPALPPPYTAAGADGEEPRAEAGQG